MYRAFFNLREDPFSLNPDPHFLFPSERHRDAFRYLLYGIKNREGFIEVIGDVGTGKTLLCRALLALLGTEVKSALILNPPYSDVEFFEYVMKDLGISRDVESRRGALESLNEFLLQEYREGRNVIIIIDEAQHLSSDLLEQVRLLSNLETEKKKLLQIILVGQPELEDRLRNPNMRQLDQRITLRYYLENLKKNEIKQYIYHRLRIAGSPGDIKFTRGALKKVYKFSKGIPRLINVACDKALLTAYFFKSKRITAKHVTIALRSTQRRWRKCPRLSKIGFTNAAYTFAILTVLFFLIVNWQSYKELHVWTKKINPVLSLIKASVLRPTYLPPATDDEVTSGIQEQILPLLGEKVAIHKAPVEAPLAVEIPKPVEAPVPLKVAEPVRKKPPKPKAPPVTKDYDSVSLANLLAIWGGDRSADMDSWERDGSGTLEYEKIARQYGLDTVLLKADLQELGILNLPCILPQITDSQSKQKLSLVLVGISEEWAMVIHPEAGEVNYARDDLSSRWSGEAIILWRNVDNLISEPISPWRSEAGIEKIEERLRQLGYFKEQPSTDMEIRKNQRARALMNFQHDHRLEVDGILGIRTRLVLYNVIDQPFTPTLKRDIF